MVKAGTSHQVRFTARGHVSSFLRPSEVSALEVQRLVAGRTSEPLGHELLREARTLSNRTPGSALVIAIAAAEVGFKELVADLVPDAQWMMEHVPSPPLELMLREYLPMLPARERINGKVVPPPKRVVDVLQRGVQWRNAVAHRGRIFFDFDDLDTVIDAIHDLLCLLDYYRGQTWSLRHVTVETRAELGVRTSGR
jgi:hypothetical protein